MLCSYTPQVVTAKGSIDAVLADGVGAMDKANAAYLNSQIPLQLNAVAMRQVSYTSVDFSTDLNAITNGNVPNVHQWREEVRGKPLCSWLYALAALLSLALTLA
jgi:hypothetical protein